MVKNAPVQHLPRDLRLVPLDYSRTERNVITTVTTTRGCLEPRAPVTSRGLVPGERGDITRYRNLGGGGERDFASQVVGLHGTDVPLLDAATTSAESQESAKKATLNRAKSLFADGHVSELCKFSPSEQEGLLALKDRLARCATEFDELYDILKDEDGARSGLPHLRERHRARLDGKEFTVEDAQREFCVTRLSERMREYMEFIDAAFAGELDEEIVVSRSQTVPTPPLRSGEDHNASGRKVLAASDPAVRTMEGLADRVEYPGARRTPGFRPLGW